VRIAACLAVLGVVGWSAIGRDDDARALARADALVRRGPEAAAEAPAVLACVERIVARASTPMEFEYWNPSTQAFWQRGLNSADEELQRAAGRIAAALPHLGEPGLVLTVAALKHPMLRVRAAMLAALHGRGSPPYEYPWPDLTPLTAKVAALLEDPDRSVRFVALAALTRLPRDPAVTPVVAALTRSPDDQIARVARHVVDGHGPIARAVNLSTLVRPGVNENDRLLAVQQLGNDPEAREEGARVIQASLASRDPRIREWARFEHDRLFAPPPPRKESVATAPITTAALAQYFAIFGPKPFEKADAARLAGLATRLRAPDQAVRAKAAHEAWRIGPAAAPLVPELAANVSVPDALPWLGHGSMDERRLGEDAARALARIGAGGLPALERIVTEGDAGARCLAVNALAEMGRDAARALPLVTPHLASPYPALRAAALRAVEHACPDDAFVIAAARRAIVDPDHDVRVEAVHALVARARMPAALPGLFQALADPDAYPAERARDALAKAGPIVR
jgi:hypothetical protein